MKDGDLIDGPKIVEHGRGAFGEVFEKIDFNKLKIAAVNKFTSIKLLHKDKKLKFIFFYIFIKKKLIYLFYILFKQ